MHDDSGTCSQYSCPICCRPEADSDDVSGVSLDVCVNGESFLSHATRTLCDDDNERTNGVRCSRQQAEIASGVLHPNNNRWLTPMPLVSMRILQLVRLSYALTGN